MSTNLHNSDSKKVDYHEEHISKTFVKYQICPGCWRFKRSCL